MRLLVDTNRYAELLKPQSAARSRLQKATEVWLSLVTVSELKAGFISGTQQQANEKRLYQLLDTQGVGVLLPDLATTSYYAYVVNQLRSLGKKIPTNDIWIAAQALQHDLTVDSDDEHLRRVQGLKFFD